MGLRFRKSVTLCKGVRLNFGKTGVSVSSGIPGFRKTVHSSGRVTTSVGIPGTGIYYVDTKNPSKKKEEKKSGGFFSDLFGGGQSASAPSSNNTSSYRNTSYDDTPRPVSSTVSPTHKDTTAKESTISSSVEVQRNTSNTEASPKSTFTTVDETYIQEEKSQHTGTLTCNKVQISVAEVVEAKQYEDISYETIKTIFENCDAAVDWIDVLSHLHPTSDDFNADTWAYLHKKAVKVFDGDIDTYLEIISTVNPYDDLLDYAEDFDFGTNDASMIDVEFSVIDDNAHNLSKGAFEDYYSAIAIRVARDTFALLPVEKTVVHVMHKSKELLNAIFDRDTFHKLDLVGQDASDVIKGL